MGGGLGFVTVAPAWPTRSRASRRAAWLCSASDEPAKSRANIDERDATQQPQPHHGVSRRAMLGMASAVAAATALGVSTPADALSVPAQSLVADTSLGPASSMTAPTVAAAALRKLSVLYESASGSFLPTSALPRLLDRHLRHDTFDRCVVIGETHDEIESHAAQLACLEQMAKIRDGRPLIVAFEQFYRGHNVVLDDFVQGRISLDNMLEKVHWDRTWGFDAGLYTPIFKFCRVNRITMVGLNLPSQVVSLTSKVGLDGLPQRLRELLPPDMERDNPAHKRHFLRAIGFTDSKIENLQASEELVLHGHGRVAEAHVDRWYDAQLLWDEYMSESIAKTMEKYPDSRIVALAGSGHVDTRTAIPDRVQRRSGERPLSIVTRPVGWVPMGGRSMPDIERPERGADVIWYTARRQDLA